MHGQCSQPGNHRYCWESERAPTPKPRHWRGMFLIRDLASSNRFVVARFWHFGAAETYLRCLNGTAPIPSHCGNSAPAASHAERWVLAA